MLRTEICDMLNIKYPLISAGMGPVAGAELAAAVSDVGGLGLSAREELVSKVWQ